MKCFRAFVAVLVIGACMALFVDRLAVLPVRADIPDPRAIALISIGLAAPSCSGDANHDLLINGADLSALLNQFARNVAPNTGADFNGDGVVNGNDLSVLLFNFGGFCCQFGFANCDANSANGCETNLGTSATNCGACGTACPNRPNATATCINGICSFTCAAGFADCNAISADGCEVNLNTSMSNCGACGESCTLPNAASSCINGQCVIVGCSAGFGDCDGNITTGCETPTVSDTHNCGACNVSCILPNASATCSNSQCIITQCNAGFDNCDDITANGCEVNHASVPNTCATAVFLGSFCANANCGNLCPASSTVTAASAQGSTSKWFVVTAQDCSTCASSLQHTIQLFVPTGIDYDLFIHKPCGTIIDSSENAAGMLDQATVSANDPLLATSTFTYWIEVRYFGGISCTPWTLQIRGRNCP